MNMKETERLELPFCMIQESAFYSSAKFPPSVFNAWKRKNGFSKPISSYSILAWSFYVFTLVGIFSVILPFISTNKTAYLVCMSILMISTTLAALRAQLANVEDERVAAENSPRNTAFTKVSGVPVITNGFCNICNVHVHPSTTHCKPCNKCVKVFDHHCIYLFYIRHFSVKLRWR